MLTGVQTIDQATVKTMYKFAIKTGKNVLVLGNAGCGKTELAIQAAEECGFEAIYLNLSVLEAPDLMGLPMIDQETKTTEYATPKCLPVAGTLKKKRVLVVDELDKGKPELQNPCLELFQFRSVNGRKLDIQAVIATGNLPDEGAFSQPISHALTNRCSVYKMESSFDPWQKWAVEANVNALVVGFLSKNPEFLLVPAPDGDDTAYSNASPRSWTLAAGDLDNAQDESVEFQTLLVAGRVGQTAAAKFSVWLTHYRHIAPMIDALVEHGKEPDVANMTTDRLMVCCIGACNEVAKACREKYTDKAKQEENILRSFSVIIDAKEKNPLNFDK
jgi:hypothetical protein